MAKKVAVRRAVVPSTLLTGLVSYWPLDETSGNRLDVVGGNHLTPSGAVTYDAGLRGNAAKFADASPDQLILDPVPSDLSFSGAQSFTLALWVYMYTPFVGQGHYRTFIDFFDGINVGGKWRYRGYRTISSAQWATIIANGENNAPNPSTPWCHGPGSTQNTWNLLMTVHDANAQTATFYVNNQVAQEGPYACPDGWYAPAAGVRLIIGSTDVATQNMMDGLIDEVGIWNRALTAGERTALYNGGAGVTYPFVGA